jgi:hypothetical protein
VIDAGELVDTSFDTVALYTVGWLGSVATSYVPSFNLLKMSVPTLSYNLYVRSVEEPLAPLSATEIVIVQGYGPDNENDGNDTAPFGVANEEIIALLTPSAFVTETAYVYSVPFTTSLSVNVPGKVIPVYATPFFVRL